jgi:hypothetical protein
MQAMSVKPKYRVDADADDEVTVSRLESQEGGVQVWRVVATFTQRQASELLIRASAKSA